MGRFAPIWCGLWIVCACGGTAADPPPADDDGTASSTSTTGETESETTFSAPQNCTESSECAETQAPFCVAPYDPGSGTIEDAACVTECVSAGDLARACQDDAGCCEGLLCNRVDGFCTPEAVESSSSSSGGDTDADTTSTGSSSSSTGSSSSSTAGGTEP